MHASLLGAVERAPSQAGIHYSRGELQVEETVEEAEGDTGGLNGALSMSRLDSIDRMDEHIEEARGKIREWQKNCEEHRVIVEQLRRDIWSKEREVWGLEHRKEILRSRRVEPPGPSSLRWVDGTVFHLISSLVVISNIGVMVYMVGMLSEGKASAVQQGLIWWLNQAFLIFYIVELVLRWLLFQHEFLFGSCDVVWNWLDLIIVIGGIVDEWILPVIELAGRLPVEETALPYVLKGLRLLRIARILKVVRTILKSDLTWAEGDRFQAFMMFVIALNCIVMGIETDYKFDGMDFVDNIFLTVYVFELLVRLRHAGCLFFIARCPDVAWNWLDFIIVVGGVIDQWLMPSYHILTSVLYGESSTVHAHGKGTQRTQIMMLLRMARLLRLLRLIRLIKNIEDLYKLVVGIIDAMQGMIWVLVLTFVLLYCFGLLCVKLFGKKHGLVWGGVDNVPDNVIQDESFPFYDLPSAMWVLFMTMNGDPSGLESLFEVLSWTKLLCAIFMVISSWAILSILTAVVSENMINANEKTEAEHDKAEKEREEREKWEKLEATFELFDRNEPRGSLTKTEFEQAMSDPEHCQVICDSTDLSQAQVIETFSLLLKLKGDGTDAVSQKDFIEGMQAQDMVPTRKEVLQLQARQLEFLEHIRGEQGLAFEIERTIASKLSSLEQTIHDRLECSNAGVETAVKAVADQIQESMDKRLTLLEEGFSKRLLSSAVGFADAVKQGLGGMIEQTIAKRMAAIEQTITERLKSPETSLDLDGTSKEALENAQAEALQKAEASKMSTGMEELKAAVQELMQEVRGRPLLPPRWSGQSSNSSLVPEGSNSVVRAASDPRHPILQPRGNTIKPPAGNDSSPSPALDALRPRMQAATAGALSPPRGLGAPSARPQAASAPQPIGARPLSAPLARKAMSASSAGHLDRTSHPLLHLRQQQQKWQQSLKQHQQQNQSQQEEEEQQQQQQQQQQEQQEQQQQEQQQPPQLTQQQEPLQQTLLPPPRQPWQSPEHRSVRD